MSKKICILTYSLSKFGGTEKHIKLLLDGLSDEFDITVITLFDLSNIIFINKNYNIIDLEIKKISFFQIILILNKIQKYDLIHSFGITSSTISVLLKIFLRKKIIFSRRDLGVWRKKKHILLFKLSNLFSDLILVNSKACLNVVKKDGLIKKNKIKLLYNGINSNDNIILNSNKNNINICCISNLRPIKNVEYLINIFYEINKIYSQTTLHIIGKGEQKIFLKKIINKLEISDKVIFYDSVYDSSDILKNMSIFIQTSYSESFSNSILEAMSFGIPCIVSDVGGNPELIDDKENGFLVNLNEPKIFVKRTIQMIEDKYSYSKISLNAKTKVNEKFSLKKMYKIQRDIYLQTK